MSDGDIFDDELFERIRKMFNLNSDMFDMDMFFLPESFRDEDSNIDDEDKQKGFKISYHFENGMDKPEIKYDGNIDPKQVKDLLKNASKSKNIKKIPLFKQDPVKNKVLDANNLSLDNINSKVKSEVTDIKFHEPYCELNEFDEFCEMIIEIPGIKRDDIILTFNDDGKRLSFSAYNDNKRYFKNFHLPFSSNIEHVTIDVNNGIARLIVRNVN